MEWNITGEMVSLIMLGIIWVYARRGSQLPSLKNKIFHGCLLVTFSAVLTNLLSTTMVSQYNNFPMLLTWIVTTIYFILTPLMGLTYFCYTVSVIYIDLEKARKLIIAGTVPGILYVLLVFSNSYNKHIFDITAAEGYMLGDWVSLMFFFFYLYSLASVGVTLFNRRRLEKEIYHILIVCPLLTMLVIFVQQLLPYVMLSGSAATCALLIIYLHLQNKQISVDYLTNLPNRQELLDMIGLLLKRDAERSFVLLIVSLRSFRHINNTCGQQKGDLFLKEVAHFLSKIGPKGNVYRFSGDEFALLFYKENLDDARKCVGEIQKRMQRPWQADEYRFMLSAAMGLISHSGEAETVENIINSIEYAVAQAKLGKGGKICYCDKEMLQKLERKRRIIQILEEQLEHPSFEMYYQPIYSIEVDRFLYAESLMRIVDSPIGPIYPSEFIPIAEETGLIVELTYIILDKVCKFAGKLRELSSEIEAVHVNFSALQFSQPDIADRVFDIIERNQTPPEMIKIEFTESTLAESPQVVADFAMKMLDRGIMMGLDDFGTGYSNIATVIHIPFGTVKLDKSLVEAAMDSENSAMAVRNLSQIFKALGMKVIAEGVETEDQKQLVTEFGVDQIQGFYYAKPMPKEEVLQFILGRK
ncbi:MAG: bifunctional diguanylate cyclase/phosphodiesterase [Faecalicatena sp.]|nr:bifunctional diguanylate cyclase/phosphodiesterase [Faecalicatena sp.]MCI6467948.1 bifunctional diguanylate cyclase/phosphodiesterase [Faecalicatena sp.]MDY5619410.1 bifunctional diguanylate cyclase/phosphodiesterase [Lachnospiraceae bacterium]